MGSIARPSEDWGGVMMGQGFGEAVGGLMVRRLAILGVALLITGIVVGLLVA